MSAGTIPPPLIITSEIAKKKAVPWNCLFELEAKDPSHFIFYTINAERPATFDLPKSFKKMNPAQRNTLLYKTPFWLMPGKRTIKAVALSPDGRESNVVSRVFHIVPCPNEIELEERLEADCGDVLLTTQTNPPKPKKFEEIRYSQKSILVDFDDSPNQKPNRRCHYCNCEYAATDFQEHRFCTQCSKPIPHYKECEPDEVYQGCNGICPACGSFCPLDAIACPVCDVTLPERQISEMKMDNNGDKICPKCSHRSPNSSTACVMCEEKFPLPVNLGRAVPPKLQPGAPCQECSGCGRRCAPDARICDWCGVSLSSALRQECVFCNLILPPFVTYCGQCGVYFDPPPRLDPRNSALGEKGQILEFDKLPAWSNVPLPDFEYDAPPPPTKSTPTPDVPKFKSRAIQAPPIIKPKIGTGNSLPQRTKKMAVSPGNGYWRQQSEFVVQHHGNLTQENQEYRQQIADLKLGQLIESNFEFHQAQDDALSQSLTVGLKFARVDHPDYPSSMDQSVRELYQNLNPKVKKETSKPKKSKKKITKKADPSENTHLTHLDRMLLAELGPRGKGRLLEMAQLIEQGADVNCKDYQGLTPLYNAVISNNPEAVESLIASGAKVNYQYERTHDTLAHITIKKGNVKLLNCLLG